MYFTEREVGISLTQIHAEQARSAALKMLSSPLGEEFYSGTVVLNDRGFTVRSKSAFVHQGKVYDDCVVIQFDFSGEIID